MIASPLARTAALTLVALVAATRVAEAALDIGAATSITTSVTGALEGTPSTLTSGDRIFQDELITTDATGVGQFEFADHTRLAIGPDSELTLDRFVFDGDASASQVAIRLGKGAFRFVTGKSGHDAYTISTTTATIGVRGTVFDLYVAENGELAIAMIEGSVRVCNRGLTCRVHSIIGRFLHMTPEGLFSLHSKWEASFFAGTSFAKALPFLSNQGSLLPALRGRTASIGRYLGSAGQAIGKATKALPKPKLPLLRLPNPFK
jgi:FecR protein